MGDITDKIRRELLYAGLSREELLRVRPLVDESNRKFLVAWATALSFFWAMSLGMSFSMTGYVLCRQVYVVALAISFAVSVGMRVFPPRSSRHLSQIMGFFGLSVIGTGLGIAMCQPDVRTVTMIAIAIALPACFVLPTLTTIVLQLSAFLAYAVLAQGIISPEVYSWGLWNLFLFSVAGVMLGHLINKSRFERFVYADSAERLAEMEKRYAYYDSMTGLLNRRAYSEEMARMGADIPSDLRIVMVDVNDLKGMNDTCGHSAGDELLVGVTECLSSAFGGVGTVYRLGGDEFCVVACTTMEDVEDRLERLGNLTAEWEGDYVHGFSVSHGVGSAGDGDDLEEIVRTADQRMYAYKHAYYGQGGHDRRRRATDVPLGDAERVNASAAAANVPSERD